MKQFVCMNWGTAYGPEYVNRLFSMVARHTSPPFRFVCYTDSTDGIDPRIECFDCPEVNIDSPKRNRGWRKLSLWDASLPGLSGVVLFLDLDVVITGSLDDFFLFKPEQPFCVIHNWTQPGRRIGNTSVYRFCVGSNPEVLHDFLDRSAEVLRTFPNSQTWISSCLERQMMFWPETWCLSFKRHCVPPGIQRWFREPALPEGARIVAFPGSPKPHQALLGQWPAPWYKRFYKRIRPVGWVQEHWK